MSSQIGLLRLSTWNVNGMTMLKTKNVDVIFLQETHTSKEECEKLCVGWVGHVFYSIGSSKSKGVVILVSKHLQFKCLNQIKDNSGRVIIVLAEIQSQKLILANIYAPNFDDQNFLQISRVACALLGIMLSFWGGGDFNLLMDPVLDKWGKAA